MIHEFAIDPAAIIECAKETSFHQRFFCEKLKQGSPAIFSELTDHETWKSQLSQLDSQLTDQQKTKMDELIRLCRERAVKRSSRCPAYGYIESQSWPQNALREDRKYPYVGIIIGSEQPTTSEKTIRFNNLADHQLFNTLKKEIDPPRNIKDIAPFVAPLLRCAQDITIVDPFFTPFINVRRGADPDGSSRGERFKDTLKNYLQVMEERRPSSPPRKIEVLTGLMGEFREYERAKASRNRTQPFQSTLDAFPFACQALYEEIIPQYWEVTFTVLQEQPKKEELHDRYIITELGSLSIPRGQDHSHRPGAVSRISLISDNHPEIWHTYKSQSPVKPGTRQGHFKVLQTCTVSGKPQKA